MERNKELETALKHHQNIIDDQTQEIEVRALISLNFFLCKHHIFFPLQYLTKQTVALREVNDSRLRIYEQLEVSIQDLERANHRLALENSADKKHIKTLTTTIENLEAKCEELQGTIDDLRLQVDIVRRKAQKAPDFSQPQTQISVSLRHVDEVDDARTVETKLRSAGYTENVSIRPRIDELVSLVEFSSVTVHQSQFAIVHFAYCKYDSSGSGEKRRGIGGKQQ